MPEIIVVGIDHSKSARRAAATARDLAIAFNAELHIITAFDSDRNEAFGSGSDRRITSQADAAETVASAVAREVQNNQVEGSMARSQRFPGTSFDKTRGGVYRQHDRGR